MQKRIDKIKEYFKELNISGNIIYITVVFPPKWAISELLEENFKVKVVPRQDGQGIYFFTDLTNGFDKLFDAIDYTIEFNKQAQEKIELLMYKIEELKELFNNEDISTLKTLKFSYKKKNITAPNKKKKKEVKEEISIIPVEEPIIRENNIEEYEEPILKEVIEESKK